MVEPITIGIGGGIAIGLPTTYAIWKFAKSVVSTDECMQNRQACRVRDNSKKLDRIINILEGANGNDGLKDRIVRIEERIARGPNEPH